MQYLRVLPLALALVGCGASSGGASATPEPAAPPRVELTEQQLRKIDPRLVERLERDASAKVPVKVRFVTMPSDTELSDLLLTRVGGLVVGTVDAATLERIATRADVAEVSYFSGAGYDDPDDAS